MYSVVMQSLCYNWTRPLRNTAIGPSPAQRRAATLKNPPTSTLPSDVISHNLIHHLLPIILFLFMAGP